MSAMRFAEYIWIDGSHPEQALRSTSRLVQVPHKPHITDFPVGKYTGKDGENSDWQLVPVRWYRDPFRCDGHFIVLCEVFDASDNAHASNLRAVFRELLATSAGEAMKPWLGFEQEYTLFRNGRPLGFPAQGQVKPQGKYYCGVGNNNVFGREVAEAHAAACMVAGVLMCGINAEAMPGQWEFQIGYRGVESDAYDALSAADDVWIARYLLLRIGEQQGVRISFDCQPVKGDWQQAGMHTHFSTDFTRDPHYGIESIKNVIGNLKQLPPTFSVRRIGETRHDSTNADNAIRIPPQVVRKGFGYLEDRRPGANADPYDVGIALVNAAVQGMCTDKAMDAA